VLLLILNVIGLILRHRSGADQTLPDGTPGAGVSRAHGVFPASVDVLVAQAQMLAGNRVIHWNREQSRCVLHHGLVREALLVMALGLLTLAGALVVQDRLGLDARMTLVPGVSTEEAQMQVHEDGRWVDRQLPMSLTCDRADPADPQRRRSCQATTADWEGSFLLAAGRDDQVAGYRVRALEETPRPGSGDDEIVLLMTRPGTTRPSQLQGRSGQSYRLSTGDVLSLFAGPHGPLVVVAEPGKVPTLMAPVLGPVGHAATDSLRLESMPSWSVVMGMTSEPQVYLWWTGFALLLIGLLMLCRPQATLRFAMMADGTAVVIDSMNRSGLPASLLDALHRSCRGGS